MQTSLGSLTASKVKTTPVGDLGLNTVIVDTQTGARYTVTSTAPVDQTLIDMGMRYPGGRMRTWRMPRWMRVTVLDTSTAHGEGPRTASE